MIVFAAIQMSAPKRKSPQSVTIKLQIEGINAFELSFTFIYSKERVYELTECQKDITSGSNSSKKLSIFQKRLRRNK